MRICLATPFFSTSRHPFMREHVVALREMGEHVDVVALDRGDRSRADHYAELVRRTARGVRVDPQVVFAAARASGLERARQVTTAGGILATQPDVVHLGFMAVARRVLPGLQRAGLPTVVSCHGSDLRVQPLGDEERRAATTAEVLAGADLVHCVSHELAEHALALGATPDRLHVAPWGVDPRFFSPADGAPGAAPAGCLRVVAVGRLHWVKGFVYALDAIARVRAAGVDAHLTIVGDTRNEEALLEVRTAIRDLGLDGVVSLRGECDRSDVRAILRDSDVFLLSSVTEGVSIALLEAMAVGLPVVATDAGGTVEAVDDGHEGLVVPSRNPAALADAVLCLARDAVGRAELGRAARARVVRDFDVRVLAARFRDRYRELCR